MTGPQDVNEIVPYLTSAACIMYAQKFLKTREFYAQFVDAFPGADKWAHRTIAAVGSLVTAVGIHVTFTGDYQHGWIIGGLIPDVWTMLHGLGDFIKVFALQQWAYDSSKQAPYVVNQLFVATKALSDQLELVQKQLGNPPQA